MEQNWITCVCVCVCACVRACMCVCMCVVIARNPAATHASPVHAYGVEFERNGENARNTACLLGTRVFTRTFTPGSVLCGVCGVCDV